MADIQYQPYKYTVNGKTYYEVLPDYNVSREMTPATMQELQSEIASYQGKTDSWSQNYLSSLQSGLSKIGTSDYVSSYQAPWGETMTLVPKAKIAEIEAGKQAGTLISPEQFKAQQNATNSNQVPQSIMDQWNAIQNSAQSLIQSYQAGNVKMPAGSISTPGTSGVSGTIGYGTSLMATQDQYIKDLQARIAAQEKAKETEVSPWRALITGAKRPSEVASEAMGQTGIDASQYFAETKAAIAELDTLNQAYNNKVSERDNALLASQQKMAPMTFIRGEQALIQNQYAIELNRQAANINSKAAIFEAKQNRWKEAQQYVEQAVANATAEQKYNMDMYQFFYNENQDVINRLDDKLQSALKDSMAQARWEYEQAYQEAQDKIQNEINIIKASSTGSGSGTDTKFWSAINAGKNELQQGEPWGNVWNRIKAQFPNASNEQIDNALGISWRLPGAYQSFKDKTMQTVTPQEESNINFSSNISQLKSEGKTKSEVESLYKKDNGVDIIPEEDQNIINDIYKKGFWGNVISPIYDTANKTFFWQ